LIIYSEKHFYYVLVELVGGLSQKSKDQKEMFFGRRSQPRAETTAALFLVFTQRF
jgi:hypothetical protein